MFDRYDPDRAVVVPSTSLVHDHMQDRRKTAQYDRVIRMSKEEMPPTVKKVK